MLPPVTLGSGEGHNWWCVMFPPLCLPAVTDSEESAESCESCEVMESMKNGAVLLYLGQKLLYPMLRFA